MSGEGQPVTGPDSPGAAVGVLIHLRTAGKRVALRPKRLRVVADPRLLQQLGALVGADRVRVRTGTRITPSRRRSAPRRAGQATAAVATALPT